MNRKEIQDILSAHADQLIDRVAPAPRQSPRHSQIQGLLDLAEHLQGVLIPMAPDANFRRRLHGDLILEAQRRGPEPEASLFEQHRKGILIGAAITSVASVVGVVIAFVLRWRHGKATHTATG